MIKGYKFVFLACLIFVALSFDLQAQDPADGENEFRLAAVNPRANASGDTLTSDAGRGLHVAHDPDLDGDGFPELIVTEYTKGGRVFVYEMIGDDMMEFVWASPPLHPTRGGGGSTPRKVTTGDFDNNGFQEIIFPIGYTASDTSQAADMGIYFFEHTGADNDYGTAPAHKLTYEMIDPGFALKNVGRTESGLRVQDIDGDGRSELLFPPRAFDFNLAKLYILQATSGTFSGGDVVIETEYVYEEMVLALPPADGYVPVGTDIGDVDSDGFDEIIVAGWTNDASGAGIGFIQIDGADSYTPGSVVPISNNSVFVVKANPLFTTVNNEPVIYVPASNGTSAASRIWIFEGIISDAFVTTANISEVAQEVGHFSIAALGDQDHPTNSAGDGLDLYLYGGGGRLLDFEYDGVGTITDPASYSVTQLYDLADLYDNFGGLFNDLYTYPGMDLDADGRRDIVAAYKGSPDDIYRGVDFSKDGFHIYFFEWGDSATSINPSVGIEDGLTIIVPDDYKLEQNYPNPFNPSTTIEFTLPINKAISLKVYNTLGQEVKTLISSQPYAAGTHQTQWDGTNNNGQQVASGIYIYQLKFGNFTKSMRMTLVR